MSSGPLARALTATAICALALLSFFQFPGHTWLQQDTQIYAPILEHQRDPSLLARDMLVIRPHVSFTLYDELTLTVERITGLDLRHTLAFEQIVFRALGIWGVYLMACAAGLTAGPALFVASIFTLGATIGGPAVLSVEYEPTPRAFAVPLVILATGLAANGRYLAAGIAGAAAFVMQPPTVYPFWAVYLIAALLPENRPIWKRKLVGILPLFAGIVLLLIAARYQAGVRETQSFFTRLEPLQESLQRLRAPYVWISIWWRQYLPHYLIMLAVAHFAYLRVNRACSPALRVYILGLPAIGLLSMPLSWLLLEKLQWGLLPQFQPLRALLFVTTIAIVMAGIAAAHAAREGKWAQAALWLCAAYMVPANQTFLDHMDTERMLAILLLAIFGAVALHFAKPALPLAAVALASFFLLPTLGHIRNYPALHTPELHMLSDWARANTPKEAVFLFADRGKALDAGVFRATAARAIYVDWKGGGQVNYLKELGEQWWTRWQATLAPEFTPARVPELYAQGIDYLVLQPRNRLPNRTPLFENARYVVYGR